MSMNVPYPMFRSFSRLGRKWFKRPRPEFIERGRDSSFEFTVVSYNILADSLLHEHPHLYFGNNGTKEPWVCGWNYRKHNLLEEMAYTNADILCLQEVQEEHYYNWFYPRLQEHGYNGVYKKRSGNKPDGCATFFKCNSFRMESYHLIDFHRSNVPVMDRNNVAILLFLSPLSHGSKNQSPVCIGNTHLLFNNKRGDIKLAQTAHLFAEIDRLAKARCANSSTYVPVIVCGDFNSLPSSPLYDFISKGELHFKGLKNSAISGQTEGKQTSPFLGDTIFPHETGLTHNCTWKNNVYDASVFNVNSNSYEEPSSQASKNERPGYLQHSLDLHSSYVHTRVDGTPEVTTCHDRASCMVDYIFYSPSSYNVTTKSGSVRHEQLWLSGVMSLLSEYELNSMGKLPNRYLSSDHLMLMASFILR